VIAWWLLLSCVRIAAMSDYGDDFEEELLVSEDTSFRCGWFG